MESIKSKDELIKRYKYIYENSMLILLPYVYVKYEGNKTVLRFKKIDEFLMLNLESFLLSDIKMEESDLYKLTENNKKDPEYLLSIKSSLKILKDTKIESVDNMPYDFGDIRLDDWDILLAVWNFISDQKGKKKNTKKEKDILDLYFEMARYTNDGNVWKGGRYRTPFDSYNGVHPKETYARIIENCIPEKSRKTNENSSNFVNSLARLKNDGVEIISEEDKEKVYFSLHKEIPWNLEIICNDNLYKEGLLSFDLKLPECNKKIRVQSDEIFVSPDNNRYFEICPHCGKIVEVKKELLNDEVESRIRMRCSKNPNLFRRMCLNSELQFLTSSDNEHTLTIKK